MTFNYYPADITKSKPLGTISLDRFIRAIQYPRPEIKSIFEQIRIAEKNKDMKAKADLKTKLYSFTPAVLVNGTRKYKNIVSFTGLLPLDFDHLDFAIAPEFKEYLFETYPWIIAAWLSPSKHGVRALAKITPPESVEEYKHYFAAIEEELEQYNGFDTATKNCILPMFLSHDPDLLHRSKHTTWQRKKIPFIPPPRPKQYIITEKTPAIGKIISRKINRIVDNGHPQLRAAAYLLGGYVGAGHIEEQDAIDLITALIDTNFYLSQKPDVYKRTAKEMIIKGQSEPTYLR